MKHIIIGILTAQILLVSAHVEAAPIPTLPIPVPIKLFSNSESGAGNVIECQNVWSLSGVREIPDEIYIGSEFASPECVQPYELVPVAENRKGGRLIINRNEIEGPELSMQLASAGDSVWLSECFISSSDQQALSSAPPAKAEFILDRGMLHRLCKGRAQVGTLNEYEFKIRKSRMLEDTERLIVAQWKALPDLMKHRINGKTRQGIWLKKDVSFSSVLSEGAVFEDDQLVPLSLEIREGFLVLIARTDSREVSDSSDCDIESVSSASTEGSSQECSNGGQAVLIYKERADQVFGSNADWISIKVRALWSKKHGAINLGGRVRLFIDGSPVALWRGDLGRNDQLAPYMMLGATLEEGENPVDVSFKQVNVKKHITAYRVNLIRNPNNYGQFADTWKVIKGDREKAFFHNRIRWAGWNSGFFGTPY